MIINADFMEHQDPRPSPGMVLFLTTITSFMTAFMGSSLNIALPIIGKEFNASALLLSWISTIYLLTTAALLLPAGRFSDMRGRIKFFKAGIILFTAGSVLCGFASGSLQLLITRAIQGTGSSLIFSTATAMLVSAYPAAQRGRVLGINIASVYTGLSSGPFLGGIITHYWSWRAIFFLNGTLGIILSVLTYIYLKHEWEETVSEIFDYTGTFIYLLSIIAIMTGLSLFPGTAGFLIFLLGFVLLFLFYYTEIKKPNPLFNFNVFRSNRTFALSNAAALINYSATFAIGFLMSFFLQTVKGMSPQEAGLILITQPVVQALFSPLTGRLSDKHEPQLVASTGMAFLTGGLIVFCFLNPQTGIVLITVNLAFLGFGFALFSSPNVNAVMSSVEKRYYGVASSILASMRMIGQMFSMGIVIVLFNVFIGHASISKANAGDFLASARTAFILFSILSFLGIFASLSRGKIHAKKGETSSS